MQCFHTFFRAKLYLRWSNQASSNSMSSGISLWSPMEALRLNCEGRGGVESGAKDARTITHITTDVILNYMDCY